MTPERPPGAPGAEPGMELLDELLAAPVIRPTAVARGRALMASGDRCPADALASQLVEDLVGEPDRPDSRV